MKLFDEWVYKNLKHYRNCSVNPKIYKDYGAEAIIEDIINHGFNHCEIDYHVRDVLKDKILLLPNDMEKNIFCIIRAW